MSVVATAGRVRADRLPDPPRDAAGRIDLDAIVDALGRTNCIVLESVPGTPHAARWSYVALASGACVVDDGEVTTWRVGANGRRLSADPFTAIDDVCEHLGLGPSPAPSGSDDDLPPFTGGLVGALSYDLGRRAERLPSQAADDRRHHHLRLDAIATLVAVDHDAELAWLVQRELPGVATGPLRELRERLRGVTRRPPPEPHAPVTVRSTLSREGYLSAVEAVLRRIAAGDVFQVNLTQRLSCRWAGDVHDLYRGLRARSPAPHGSVLPSVGVASISPETFLEVRDGRVATRPMKGTRPRNGDDPQGREELGRSTKDRAENVMVVDIERNDLGRVCQPGSVTVPRLCEVEQHPTVWQLVSTVEGELRPDVGWGQLLRHTFPSGSITGAPKIAAMEIIEGLEPVRRSWYCGAIGWIGAGAARLSVAIRTAVLGGDVADYGAGGGIVADSDPVHEYDESVVKAGPFLAAVGGRLEDR